MEIISFLIVASIALYIVKSAFGIFTGPKRDNYFVCSSCGIRVKHSARTLSAWKNGRRTSMCGNCHKRWVEAQAAARKAQSRSSFLGCLVLLAIAVVLIVVVSQ